MIDPELIARIRVPPGKNIRLKDYDTGWAVTDELKALGKDEVKAQSHAVLHQNLAALAEAQELLSAAGTHAVLFVLQAMDAAGKDGTIKHVMAGVNPQGCQVFSFKKPSSEELAHTFLWRCMKVVPERGRIGIFNRSYYEDVLITKVHPEILAAQKGLPEKKGKSFWKDRYDDINAFERHLTRNGTLVLKFFLNVSKKEQKRRFLERLDHPAKNWKFSDADLAERTHWDAYMTAYEDALNATGTDWAPWYIIPADKKWAARAVVADILTTAIHSLDLKYPTQTEAQRAALTRAKEQLLNE